ncbi:uncharacterized protein L203_105314 [Cryptococcus depauperatus CBS 7841]|uniref:Uncharacterized protein n=1 Tax=Cryptococcus depauperatus CBS 7841 TaxID=1295531 RepID=A0A1E3HLL9_9TREE|nr:hypothetical protein L203_06309 [Cryptococcus depauperatus CBS 7841]
MSARMDIQKLVLISLQQLALDSEPWSRKHNIKEKKYQDVLQPISESLWELKSAYDQKANNVLEKGKELHSRTLQGFLKAVSIAEASSLDADSVFKKVLDEVDEDADRLCFCLKKESMPSQSGAGAGTAAQSTAQSTTDVPEVERHGPPSPPRKWYQQYVREGQHERRPERGE